MLPLLLLAACTDNGRPSPDNGQSGQGTSFPPSISYAILKAYPHDTSSFTQGLVIYKGSLYEGTGNYGSSKLLQTDLATGKAIRSVSLSEKYFGEGITILNDTIYQLTWKEKVVFAYTLKDLKKVKEFPIGTEGWGITTDGKQLIVTDGSSNLYFYEPSAFRLMRTQSVTWAGTPSYNLNELEYIDGYVYANQWQQQYIFKIDPSTGEIVGRVDLGDVWYRVQQNDRHADVPNGIAHDDATGKTYITGKNWPELYEIQFGK